MPNRARNYMDRLLGRNEGNEGRDFTEERRYGDDQRFYDEPLYGRDDHDRYEHARYHRTQSSRTRPRYGEFRSDYDRDYNVRRNPPTMDDYRAHTRPPYFRNTERGFFGKGPKGWKLSDDRIKEEVSEALYRDYHVDASEIEIEVKDGVVTLNGTIDSREAKRSAEECIENLSGVSDVHNRLRVADQSNVSNLRSANDANGKRSLS